VPEHDPNEYIEGARDLLRDASHQLAQERALGAGKTLNKLIALAKDDGASEEQVAAMLAHYPTLAQELVEGRARSRRKRKRRKVKPENRLPAAQPPRQLPPGE